MKKFFLIALSIAGAFAVNAQQKSSKQVQYSGGIRVAIPVGNFHLSHSLGIGAELGAEYKLQPNVSLTGTTGFTNFIGKKEKFGGFEYKYDAVGYIPILVGARFYPSSNVFVGGKVGYGILTGAGSGGAFNLEPGVGYNADKFQVAIGYNALIDDGTLGHFGVSAVYKFN